MPVDSAQNRLRHLGPDPIGAGADRSFDLLDVVPLARRQIGFQREVR